MSHSHLALLSSEQDSSVTLGKSPVSLGKKSLRPCGEKVSPRFSFHKDGNIFKTLDLASNAFVQLFHLLLQAIVSQRELGDISLH